MFVSSLYDLDLSKKFDVFVFFYFGQNETLYICKNTITLNFGDAVGYLGYEITEKRCFNFVF